ncbi:conserved hypothetical protein [Culex quinquefasciatus]|uniref:glutathione-specific gamma-glutamylcyclotransferase n=1 Tax=Culex quinquefasciatus TaxID=7176 RepID=B0WFJ3_CULQU|nr:conserved hypothetical protein [Culex quinquefasciatus]|eukprot:XP_001847477.1 conserved hypothetical protein [Culex quinquefasciatus]
MIAAKFAVSLRKFKLLNSISKKILVNMSSNALSICDSKNEEETWIFGYGSLVWKADFPFEEQRTGFVKGFCRRFYQNSIDHRGTHDKPGRVVTLIQSKDPDAKVWGMGYRIGSADTQRVLCHLDHREKNGYDRHRVLFYPYPPSDAQTNDPKNILLYVATVDNPSFAGQSDSLEAIAGQILSAAGESGKNPEYVYKLAEAMRQLYPGEEDEHLFELERILRAMDTGDGTGDRSVSGSN